MDSICLLLPFKKILFGDLKISNVFNKIKKIIVTTAVTCAQNQESNDAQSQVIFDFFILQVSNFKVSWSMNHGFFIILETFRIILYLCL